MRSPERREMLYDAVRISDAMIDDGEQILKLQFLCYQSEAALYDDYRLPPLLETLDDFRQASAAATILVARLDDEVVGAVRGRLVGTTCHVGRLVVHPRLRRRGLGTRLVRDIERRFPTAEAFELFTGHLSLGNLAMYKAEGYRRFREEQLSQLRVVHLRKAAAKPTATA